MDTAEQIQAIEQNIADAKAHLHLGEALLRLEKNADFKAVISSGYLREQAIRLVLLKADPAMQTPDKQASIVRQIDAIGELHDYFRGLRYNVDAAKKAIASAEEVIDDLRAEAGHA
jgi:hypothetical protein